MTIEPNAGGGFDIKASKGDLVTLREGAMKLSLSKQHSPHMRLEALMIYKLLEERIQP